MSNWDEVKIITWNCGVEEQPIACAHCGAEIPELQNDYADENHEDVCVSCYETDVEPYEVWDEDEEEIIGWNMPDLGGGVHFYPRFNDEAAHA